MQFLFICVGRQLVIHLIPCRAWALRVYLGHMCKGSKTLSDMVHRQKRILVFAGAFHHPMHGNRSLKEGDQSPICSLHKYLLYNCHIPCPFQSTGFIILHAKQVPVEGKREDQSPRQGVTIRWSWFPHACVSPSFASHSLEILQVSSPCCPCSDQEIIFIEHSLLSGTQRLVERNRRIGNFNLML